MQSKEALSLDGTSVDTVEDTASNEETNGR